MARLPSRPLRRFKSAVPQYRQKRQHFLRRAAFESLEPRNLLALTFEFNYEDGTNIGFNDPVLGAARKSALEAAATRFGSWFDHTATIQIDVVNSMSIPTGGTGQPNYDENGAPPTGQGAFYLSVAEQKILQPQLGDTNGATADGVLTINWGGLANNPWELGHDVQSPEVDFTAVVTHELTHIVGFLTGIQENGTDLWNSPSGTTSVWTPFDKFISDNSGSSFINPNNFQINLNAWNAQKTNGGSANTGLFFNGPQAQAANGNQPVPLHSPNPFVTGSSISHVRIDSTFTDDTNLMLATLRDGGVTRRFHAVEIGMLKDLGFSINALPTGVSIEESASATAVSEGGTNDTFTVRLESKPTGNVVLNLTSTDTDEVTVSPATLTFTSANWQTVRIVTVTGVNDTVADGAKDIGVTISVDDNSSADAYDPVPDQTVMVAIDDLGNFDPFLVTTADDEDNTPATGGAGLSLREAIKAANATAGTQTITFASTLEGQTFAINNGELAISDSVTITGPGTRGVTLDADGASRILNIDDGTATLLDVSLDKLTLTRGNGNGNGSGGAIRSKENVTIVNSTISGSSTSGTNFGGGIYHRGGLLTIRNSTISGNTAYSGGGLINYPGAGAIIDSSTISGNTETGFAGGGIFNQAPLVIRNSTITNNTSDFAGGIYSLSIASSAFVIQNSIIAGNKHPYGTQNDLRGTTPTVTRSLIGVNTNTSLAAGNPDGNGNFIGTVGAAINPQLAPLGDYGGITQTHALNPGSPAINSGSTSFNTNNVAPLGVASQSTNLNATFVAALAIDGSLAVNNFTHTADRDPAPSWEVALPEDFSISRIVLHNRGDCCQNRLRDITVRVLNAGRQVVASSGTLNANNFATLEVDLGSAQTGRIVRVERAADSTPDQGILSLREVEIFATSTATAPAFDQRGTPFNRQVNTIDMGAFEVQPLVVTTADDELDSNSAGDPTDMSLREALQFAELTPGADTITFSPALRGTTLQLSTIGDNTQGSTAFLVNTEVTIQGPIEISRDKTQGDMRLFFVDVSGKLTLDTVTLSNGEAVGGNGGSSASGGGGGGGGFGGAILNRGTVTINRSTLTGNLARGGNGGTSGVGGLGQGGGGGGGLIGNGANSNSDNGAQGNSGGGTGGNKMTGNGYLVLGGDGQSTTTFGAGGGGGGFGQSTGGNFVVGGLGGNGGFGGGGGGEGRAAGAQVAVSEPSSGGFGGGQGHGNGGGGGGGLGGAVFNYGGTVTITNSTLSGNSAVGGDGGAGTGATFEGQGGYGHGGAVFNRNGTVTIRHSTLADNVAGAGGGSNTGASGTAIYNLQEAGMSATVNMFNSILASSDFRSVAVNDNDNGTVNGSGNLIEANGNFPAGVIVSSAAPLLGPLANNGGPTKTHALLANSPALDAGDDSQIGGLISDQRGAPFAREVGNRIDIGAFEFLAVPLVVSTLNDELDTNLSDGDLSLREALSLSNVTAEVETITFKDGLTGAITLALGELVVSAPVNIAGRGAETTIIDGQQQSRVFHVTAATGDVAFTGVTIRNGLTRSDSPDGGGIRFDSTGTLTLANSTISGNSAANDGGAIYAKDGAVTVTDSTISQNLAVHYGGGIRAENGAITVTRSTISGNQSSYQGGGIYTHDGAVTITGSTISGNSAVDDGGGIYARYGAVTVTDSTISGNRTTGYGFGGGIYANNGAATITGSTISGNSAVVDGGGIYADQGAVTITNSTISGNTAGQDGGGIYFDSSAVVITNSTITGNTATGKGGGIGIRDNESGEKLTIRNSIIAGNTDDGTAPDFEAPANPGTNLSVQFSLIGDNTGSSLDASPTADADGNLIGTSIIPLLGPLQNNSGPTFTHALLANSPAIDAGSNELAVDGQGTALATDQRGTGFPRIAGTKVDMGAFELPPSFGFTFSHTDGNTQVTEGGTTDTFTVVLTGQPTSIVVLTVTSGDTGEATVDLDTLTFTPLNAGTPQTVTVTGVNDPAVDADQGTNITLAVNDAISDNNYTPLLDQDVLVTTTDNDEPGFTIVEPNGNTRVFENGSTDTFTVVLNAQPLTDVVLTIVSNGLDEATVNPATLTFTPGNFDTAQIVTVTGVDDQREDGDQPITITVAVNDATSADAFDDLDPQEVNVTVVEQILDFGDAPAPYPTLLANNGAAHQLVGATLGALRDKEADGQPHAQALGDDAPNGFADAVQFNTNSGGNAQSTAVGDVNRDGELDLVVGVIGNGAVADSVAVLLGNGDGSFKAAVNFPISGTGLTFVALGLLDDDANIDIATANGNSSDASVLLGNGDGTFQAATTVDIGFDINAVPFAAFGPNQLSLTDINNDQNLDLLTVNAFSDDVSVLLGNGDGTFQAASVLFSGVFGASFGFTVADVDGDTQQDIVVAHSFTNDLAVLLGNGDGTFAAPVINQLDPQQTGAPSGSGLAAVGDFNRDGSPDLISANANSNDLSVWIGNKTANFVLQPPIALPNAAFPSTLIAQDLNGDGKLDVVVTNQGSQQPQVAGNVSVLLGNGDGTFQAPTNLSGGLNAGDAPFRLALGDLNGDGAVDIAADVGAAVAVFFAAGDDEDGITFGNGGTLTGGTQGSATVNLQNADNASNKLDAWIDFNRDGDWDDAGEQIFTSRDLGTANGPQVLNFAVPANAVAGASFARFRLSKAGGLLPTGLANDGEVEDYAVQLQAAIPVAGFTIVESNGNTRVSESGTTDSFTVVLNIQPTLDVVFNITSADPGEATVDLATLTFTPQNFATAQTVTVTGIDDSVADGDQNFNVTVSVNDGISANEYDTVDDQVVQVTTTDDDAPGFTIAESNGGTSVSETGTTDSFTVVLNTQPTGTVVLNISSADTGEATASPATLTFTAQNFNTPQTVTVTGVNDPALDGNQVTAITLSVNVVGSAAEYANVANQAVQATTTDDDVAGFTITLSNNSTVVSESGTTDSFTVVLTAQPATDVVLTVTSGNTNEATVDKATLTFNAQNFNQAQTIIVTGIDDQGQDGSQTTTITLAVDDNNSHDAFDAVADQTVSVTTTDNDSPLNADAGGPYSIDAGVALQLDGSNSTGPGSLTFRWDLNNDNTADFTTQSSVDTVPWLTLANLVLGAGQHTISLIVADNSGESPADPATLTISSNFVFTNAAGSQTNQFTLSRANNQIEVRDSNPPNNLLSSVPATGVQQVTVTGSDADDMLTVDYTNGDPLPAGGVAFDGAGGRDTFVIGGHDVTLDLTNQTAFRFTDVEVLNIVGASPNTLKLTPADVLRVTDGNDTLTVVSDTDETVDLGAGWRITSTAVDAGKFVRILTSGAATLRMIGPSDWTNPLHPFDVNADGFISPLDVLITINEQNSPQFSDGQRLLTSAAGLVNFPDFYFDATGDGFIVPLDTLQIINHLNTSGSTAVPEGEGAAERGGDGEWWRGRAIVFDELGEREGLGSLNVVANGGSRDILELGAEQSELAARLADLSRVATQPTPSPVRRMASASRSDTEAFAQTLDDLFAEDEFWRS